MRSVEISDQAYHRAEVAASESGVSLDAYLESLIADAARSAEDWFTHERLAKIDRADDRVRAGDYLTVEELKADLAANRAAWLRETHL